jgi:hypothetical protein
MTLGPHDLLVWPKIVPSKGVDEHEGLIDPGTAEGRIVPSIILQQVK